MNCFNFLSLLILTARLVDVFSQPKVRNDCACGEANIENSGRIVNGRSTTPNKYPWMAAMFSSKGKFSCGGSVISDRNILTAGHCVFYPQNPMGAYWLLGMHERDFNTGEKFSTADFEIHPNFKNSSFFDDYDLALITVDRSISFHKNVNPICLPQNLNRDFSGKLVTVSGWGRLGERFDSPLAITLMEAKVWMKSDKECTKMTKRFIPFNTKSMVCAYDIKTDACQGDSGGPLFIETDPNRHEIIGAVSFGEGCARDTPGIYAKIADVDTLRWIQNYVTRSSAVVCSDPPRVRSRSLKRFLPAYRPSSYSYLPQRPVPARQAFYVGK